MAMFVGPSLRLSSLVLDLTSSIWPTPIENWTERPYLQSRRDLQLGSPHRRITDSAPVPGGSGAELESQFRL